MALALSANGPLFFTKWDIKDGFWHLIMSPEDAWHFCYILPTLNNEPIQLVVPTSLQMGWCKSLAFFCSTSETSRDIAQLLLTSSDQLPKHPLESLCLPPPNLLPALQDQNFPQLLQLLEVYVDDFIGLLQAPNITQAQHFTWAVLHAIHKVFPPVHVTGHINDEPVALKKLQAGDSLWSTCKEILGWLFDGLAHTIMLPPEKVTSLAKDLQAITCFKHTCLWDLQCIQGCLIHASYGIPNGKGLLSPIMALIAKHATHPHACITLDPSTKQALLDWHHVLCVATKEPTLCSDLVPAAANYIGYCNASKNGCRWGVV